LPYVASSAETSIEVSGPPPPPSGKGTLACDAFFGPAPPLQARITADIEVVGVGTYKTPFTLDLDPGDYVLNFSYYPLGISYLGEKRATTAHIVEGQTTKMDFGFWPLWCWAALGGGVIVIAGGVYRLSTPTPKPK
jgi:hypothetical protein